MPKLVVVGDADVFTPPSEARAIWRGVPGASLHVFGRCGHLPAMQRPTQTTLLLRRWLADE